MREIPVIPFFDDPKHGDLITPLHYANRYSVFYAVIGNVWRPPAADIDVLSVNQVHINFDDMLIWPTDHIMPVTIIKSGWGWVEKWWI